MLLPLLPVRLFPLLQECCLQGWVLDRLGKNAEHEGSRPIPNKFLVCFDGMLGKSQFGQDLIGRQGNVFQGINQGTIQIKQDAFEGCHRRFQLEEASLARQCQNQVMSS